MTTIRTSTRFEKALSKLDAKSRQRLAKLVRKILDDPGTGKPLRYGRRGERSVRMTPYRLVYAYDRGSDTLFLLTLGNRDRVYRDG